MILEDFVALSPILNLGAFSLVTMLAIAFRRHHARIAIFAFMSCLLTLATLPWAATATSRAVTTLLVVDGHALLYMGLVLSATMVVIALSYRYLTVQFHELEGVEEYTARVTKCSCALASAVLQSRVSIVAKLMWVGEAPRGISS